MEDHWNRMPDSWAHAFRNIPPENLADFLTSSERRETQRLWPLSLLALQVLLRQLCISREPMQFKCSQVSAKLKKMVASLKL